CRHSRYETRSPLGHFDRAGLDTGIWAVAALKDATKRRSGAICDVVIEPCLLPSGSQPMHRARLSHCLVALTLLLTLFLAATAPATAQSWPTRPVKFILTLGPGSGADISARMLADRLTEKRGQPIVIEKKPGRDGVVAINAFVSAKDDHVLLYAPSSSFIGHPYQHDNLPYKPSDLATIARVSNTVVAISVPKDLSPNSLKEVVELARAKPGELNWAGLTGALDIMFEG